MILLRSVPRSSVTLRALVATVEITTFAGVAHAFAGGALPSFELMTALAALVMAASMVALRGTVKIRTAVPLVASLQVVLHVAFALTAPAAAGHAGHSSQASLAGDFHLNMPVLAAHLATTVVTALVLVTQDRAVVIVQQWLATLSPRLVDVAPTSAPIAAQGTPLTRWVFLRQAPRRGPPVIAAATP